MGWVSVFPRLKNCQYYEQHRVADRHTKSSQPQQVANVSAVFSKVPSLLKLELEIKSLKLADSVRQLGTWDNSCWVL